MSTAGGAPGVEAIPPEIRQAFRRWADRAGGPGGLDALITGCAASDMVIVRVVTSVRRRDLSERRVAVVYGAPRGGARVAAEAIDPFALPLEQLRARTEHMESCQGCAGAGRIACGACAGSGRSSCPECGGSGEAHRQNEKASRFIRCPECRTKGTVPCGACRRSGELACSACAGSGLESVWWSFHERVTTTVRFEPEGPIVHAHPALREERALQPSDVAAFATLSTADVASPYRAAPDDDPVLARLTPRIEPRVEQIAMRQLQRIEVPRRVVQYEMCGARGTVALLGRTLEGSTTPEATAPINRHRALLAVAGVAIAALAWRYTAALQGPTAYFNNANVAVALLAAAGALAAAQGVSGLLRAWRPGGGRWPLRRRDVIALGALLPIIALGPLVAFASRRGRPASRDSFQPSTGVSVRASGPHPMP